MAEIELNVERVVLPSTMEARAARVKNCTGSKNRRFPHHFLNNFNQPGQVHRGYISVPCLERVNRLNVHTWEVQIIYLRMAGSKPSTNLFRVVDQQLNFLRKVIAKCDYFREAK